MKQKGFTLIEMVVVLGIFVVMSTIVLVKNQEFRNSVLIGSVAYDVAISIREAQISSLGVSENPLSGEDFDTPWGVVFDSVGTMDDPTEYHIGVDTDGNGHINDTEITKTFKFKDGFNIALICGSQDTHGVCEETHTEVNITFVRPDPNAFIETESSVSWVYTELHVAAPDGGTTTVSVSNTGQISVQ